MQHAAPLAFPAVHPDDFPPLASEPVFDPARHLALEAPDTVVMLEAFGYSEAEIQACPTLFAITSPFRVLSTEGAECLLEVARSLSASVKPNPRIERCVRGGAYQSRFLRDFCLSMDVAEFMGGICGAPLLPHTIPHQLGHLNYNSETVGANVDKWHYDTLRIDYVLFVTDPASISGGEFEYFQGTKHAFKALRDAGEAPPADQIMSANAPGPGYAVLQQGNMVVHRAKGLTAPGERVTCVNGYVSALANYPDFTRFDQLYMVDPPHVVASEYARHAAWIGREALDAQINAFQFTEDREALAASLDRAAQDLARVADELRRADQAEIDHFGDT